MTSWWQRLRHGTVRAIPTEGGDKLGFDLYRHRFLRRPEHLGRSVYALVDGVPQTIADGGEVQFYPAANVGDDDGRLVTLDA